MANGKVRQYNQASVWEASLLLAQEGNTSSEWFATAGLLPMSFDIQGIVGSTVQLRGSNNPTEPAQSDDGHLLGSNFTSDAFALLEAPVKWVKAKVTNWTSGTISIHVLGYYKK